MQKYKKALERKTHFLQNLQPGMKMRASEVSKSQSVILVGQNSVNYYIQVVVVALLSVVLVGFVIPVSVILVVDCTFSFLRKTQQKP